MWTKLKGVQNEKEIYSSNIGGNINVSEEHGEKLMLVESSGGYGILADKDTGVMYLFIENGGGITAMLNTDGTPKIWQGEE